MINLKRLEKLKSKLSREKELSVVWSFYMDHFADHAEFIDLGKPTQHPLVEQVIIMVSKQLFKQAPHNILLIGLSDYQFIHGSFMVGGRIGGVIYFEESMIGMLAIAESLSSSLMQYSRFSGQSMGSYGKADLN